MEGSVDAGPIEGLDAGPIEGLDAVRTAIWLGENVGLRPPISFELIAGGRSNLTYKLTDATGEHAVLRRPPVGHVLPTAHDMVREHRVLSALGPTAVPVPQTRAVCTDKDVTGAPFYVMGFVPGHVIRDAASAEAVLGEEARRQASESVARVLAELHLVDVDEVGLGDLGRREGYLSRQLERWHGQFDKMQPEGFERVALVDDLYERLLASTPRQRRTTIVHGDYRLDNTVLGDDGSVRAVLDWEICTLGDPLADLGLLMVYWAEPGDRITALGAAPTMAAGFASRAELRDWYAECTGHGLESLDYYIAFGYWKLACILQGVMYRYLGGAAGGDRSGGVETFATQVRALAEAADRVEKGLSA